MVRRWPRTGGRASAARFERRAFRVGFPERYEEVGTRIRVGRPETQPAPDELDVALERVLGRTLRRHRVLIEPEAMRALHAALRQEVLRLAPRSTALAPAEVEAPETVATAVEETRIEGSPAEGAAPAEAPVEAAPPPGPPPLPAFSPTYRERLWARLAEELGERMLVPFTRIDAPFDGQRELERAVREVLLEEAYREAAQVKLDRTKAFQDHVDILRRRVRKLTQAVRAVRQAVVSARGAKTIDPGLASIYRTVQGLSEDDGLADVKREMLADIFQANLRLKEQLGR